MKSIFQSLVLFHHFLCLGLSVNLVFCSFNSFEGMKFQFKQILACLVIERRMMQGNLQVLIEINDNDIEAMILYHYIYHIPQDKSIIVMFRLCLEGL